MTEETKVTQFDLDRWEKLFAIKKQNAHCFAMHFLFSMAPAKRETMVSHRRF